jgi:SAM-dependent methyltransferase
MAFKGNVASVYNAMADGYDANDDTVQFLAEDEYVYHHIIQPHLKPDSFVVDLGCGTGRAITWLGLKPDNYHGYDISKAMLDKAVEKFGSDGYVFSLEDARDVTPVAESVVISLYGSPCYQSVAEMIDMLDEWRHSERFFLVYGRARNLSTYEAQHEKDVEPKPVLYGYEELKDVRQWFVDAEFTGIDVFSYNKGITSLDEYKSAVKAQAILSQTRSLNDFDQFAWVLIHIKRDELR